MHPASEPRRRKGEARGWAIFEDEEGVSNSTAVAPFGFGCECRDKGTESQGVVPLVVVPLVVVPLVVVPLVVVPLVVVPRLLVVVLLTTVPTFNPITVSIKRSHSSVLL